MTLVHPVSMDDEDGAAYIKKSIAKAPEEE